MAGKQILIVIGTLDLGGAEKHLSMVLPELVAKGWDVRVYLLRGGGVLVAPLEAAGVTVIQKAHPRYLDSLRRPWSTLLRAPMMLWRLYRYLQKNPPDVVHFFLPESYILGMLASMRAKLQCPTVMSRRSMNYYQQKRTVVRELEHALHGRVTRILANSQRVYDQLHREESVPSEKLGLLYNGIDLRPFESPKGRQEIRDTLNLSDDTLVFIMVANLIAYKGHTDLIEALSRIQNKLPERWHLLCVGYDGGQLGNLKQLSEQKRLSSHISWLGSRTDVPDLLNASDIGILCSHEEGFSNAVLEGMAAGLPMVVTDVGGNAEAVIDGETGYVTRKSDPHKLAKRLLDVANSTDLRRQFGEQGKLRVEGKFSLQTCVDQYHSLYENLLNVQGA